MSFALVVLAALGMGWGDWDDRDVIQTVLLYPPTWSDGRPVVLRPDYYRADVKRPPSREGYAEKLGQLVADIQERVGQNHERLEDRQHDLAQLRALRGLADTAEAAPTYIPAPIVPLGSFRWDPRIIVTDKGGKWWRPVSNGKTEARLSRVGLFATMSPPSYSADGSACIVEFSFPWSIHMGTGVFVLRRLKGGWNVVYHEETILL